MRMYLKSRPDIKETVLLVVLTAEALILSLIESYIPNPIDISGVKLSLTNIITVAALIFFRFSDTLIIIFIRCILASLFVGEPTFFMFSICGSIFSAIIIWIMLKTMQKWFSIVGISIAGSVAYNTSQILVASFIMGDLSVTVYLPELLISAVFIGYIVGICSTFLVKTLRKLNIIPNL